MITLGFVLPHLRAGGAERCVVNWIGALDRSRVRPLLFLKSVEGQFLDLLPRDVTPIPLGGARAMRLPGAIVRALDLHGVDVAYSATNAMNLALLNARCGAAPIVSEHTTPTEYLAEAKLATLRRFAMRRYYPRATAIAVPTDRIGRDLVSCLGRPLPIVTIPNPVIGTLPEPESPADSATLRILSAGRLVSAKGFDVLIEACAKLARDGVDFVLTICGEGPLRDALAAQIAAAGLDERVLLRGYSDLAAFLRDSDLFVLASRREGFGNVLVEAMAGGVPVVATRSGGPDSFIADGISGHLVAPNDPAELAQRIAVLRDPMRRVATVGAARDVAARFGIEASTAAFTAMVARAAATRSIAA